MPTPKPTLAALGAVSLLLGCDATPTRCEEVGTATLPLRGASVTGGPSDDARRNAVVALATNAEAVPDELCSGVLVDPELVLSAAHCTSTLPVAAKVWLGTSLTRGSSIEIAEIETADGHDLALVHLRDAVESEHARPIAVQLAPPEAGTTVTLAGYGLAEQDELGTRRFVEERVQSLTRDHIVVTGEGKSGACGGDSGGPLLTQDESTDWHVVGVLSLGSTSCLEIDLYQRLDVAEAWLRARLDSLACEL